MERTYRVLLVEDEDSLADITKRKIEKCGPYACDTAANGLQALEKIQHSLNIGEVYDCIFLDIKMPSMSGLEFLKKLKQFENDAIDIAVVMLTAYKDTEKWKEILSPESKPISFYLSKPVNLETLEKTLKLIVDEDRKEEFRNITKVFGEEFLSSISKVKTREL